MNDEVAIAQNKTGVMDKELEKNLDNLALMKLRKWEYFLRLTDIPEEMDEETKKRLVSFLATF